MVQIEFPSSRDSTHTRHAVVAAQDDPIFALIEEHRRAIDAVNAAGDFLRGETAEENEARAVVAGKTLTAAEDALVASTPATVAGALALLRYARKVSKDGYSIFQRYDDDYSLALFDWAERAITALVA